MLHLTAILAIGLAPSNPQTFESRVETVPAAQVDEFDWIYQLLDYLNWLCEVLGPEFCNPTAGLNADVDMLYVITAYQLYGVDDDLTGTELLEAQDAIEALYAHASLSNAGGTLVVRTQFKATLSDMYEDLGGDPDDL
jgi:hypothetical protein